MAVTVIDEGRSRSLIRDEDTKLWKLGYGCFEVLITLFFMVALSDTGGFWFIGWMIDGFYLGELPRTDVLWRKG